VNATTTLKETAVKTLPYVQLPCPRCSEGLANFALNLWTLDDPDAETFTCQECGESVSLTEVRTILACWAPIVSWLVTIPGIEA
jgi:hypothetical protein